jgi:DNA-directed RNA polymerase subunit RPC12/RpoP
MTIDFTCQKCEASFELDAQDLIDGTEKVVCPNCEAKAPGNLTDDFIAALTEMRAQAAVMGKKFAVNLAIETEDLDPAAVSDDEEEEEDDEDESDEDELDFDEDDEDAAADVEEDEP